MVSVKGKEGLALLVVVIVIVAAVSVAVVVKNNDDSKNNPNHILGMYEIDSYTQYGGRANDSKWEWYEGTKSVGPYGEERISIDKYDSGTVRATCYIDGKEFEILGYYDPDSKAFGYTSFYEFDPEQGDEKCIDWLQGMIVGDTMYLCGYTVSATETENPLMYTFNFTFVKEGKTAEKRVFEQALKSKMTSTKTGYVAVGIEDVQELEWTYEPVRYSNGIYSITDEDDQKVTAVTMYQDDQRTVLRMIECVENQMTISWVVIEGNTMYEIWGGTTEDGEKYSAKTLYSCDGSEPEFPATYPLQGKLFVGDLRYDSSMYSTSNVKSTTFFKYQAPKTGIGVTAEGSFISYVPGIEGLAFFYEYKGDNGVHYYGDMLGEVMKNGEIYICGFFYGDNGEVVYAHGTIKDSAA